MTFSDAPTSAGYGGAQQQESPNDQESQSQFKKSLEEQLASPLNRQGSIFSLTLDEIQLKSGKSVGSMNMDEFLTNLWNNVDENQVTSQPPPDTNSNSQNKEPIMDNNLVIETAEPPPTLARQNSFSIPIQLCKKTVEQVWSEIQKDQPPHHHRQVEPPQRQPTFGEITLEEFLIKAGVVQEPATRPCPHPRVRDSPPMHRSNNNNNACLDTAYGMGLGPGTCPMVALGFSATQPSMGSNFLVNGYAAYPIYTAPAAELVGQLARNDSNNGDDNETSQGMMLEAVGPKGNRKRIIDGPHEVVVERRQRRMIKNRESAARSRARKQAYTVELELELTQLKAENDKLKEAVKELEQKRVQEISKRMFKQLKMARKNAEKLRTLKRIVSSAW